MTNERDIVERLSDYDNCHEGDVDDAIGEITRLRTALEAEREAGKTLASEVAEWRDADMYGDMLGTVAGDYDKDGADFDATGYAHRESVRTAQAACNNNGVAAAHIAAAKKGDER